MLKTGGLLSNNSVVAYYGTLRTAMPPNALPSLTYLNEELVEFPKGVADRTEAINYRLDHAGLTRKIGTNQVRVIRIMLTGSHNVMKRIAAEGRI